MQKRVEENLCVKQKFSFLYTCYSHSRNVICKRNVKRLGLGHGTWDLGPGTWDMGLGTWDLGPGTWDLGPGTWDLGPRT